MTRPDLRNRAATFADLADPGSDAEPCGALMAGPGLSLTLTHDLDPSVGHPGGLVSKLQDVINFADAQEGKKLTPAEADQIRSWAQTLIDALTA